MATLTKGDLKVTTKLPSEITTLKSQGFKLVDEAKPAAPAKK